MHENNCYDAAQMERVKEGEYARMCEGGTLKPVKVILRTGKGGRIIERMDQTGVHCMHIWKITTKPIQLLYTNKMFKNEKE
jgi:hypothetical protein